MARHLLVRLESPLMSFGRTAVDHRRPVQPWPAASMLTGLLANALGWERSDASALDRLQTRLRWAARLDRPGVSIEDFQTAQLSQQDRGWTTSGIVEERAGGAESYKSPHLRYRDHQADASVLVAIRLEPEDEAPTLATLAAALDRPQRPLFIGRKACIPATRLSEGLVDAVDGLGALQVAQARDDAQARSTLYFNEGSMREETLATLRASGRLRTHHASDERRFDVDTHAGRQKVHECTGWTW